MFVCKFRLPSIVSLMSVGFHKKFRQPYPPIYVVRRDTGLSYIYLRVHCKTQISVSKSESVVINKRRKLHGPSCHPWGEIMRMDHLKSLLGNCPLMLNFLPPPITSYQTCWRHILVWFATVNHDTFPDGSSSCCNDVITCRVGFK